jgi:hypothetical protein
MAATRLPRLANADQARQAPRSISPNSRQAVWLSAFHDKRRAINSIGQLFS